MNSRWFTNATAARDMAYTPAKSNSRGMAGMSEAAFGVEPMKGTSPSRGARGSAEYGIEVPRWEG